MSASNEERQAIRQACADFCRAATEGGRVFAAMTGPSGYDSPTWTRMTQELGLTSLLLPEQLGGLGLGFAEAAIVIAEAGRTMLPSPLLPTLAVSQTLVRLGTDTALDVLAKASTSGASMTLALHEAPYGLTNDMSTIFSASDGTLRGRKRFVLNGDSADVLVVGAADGRGRGLFAVEGSGPGVVRTAQMTLDQTRRLATIELQGARATRISGPVDVTVDPVEYAENVMLVALAVEAAASAQECLARTVDYLNVREQFGRVLGSFQALRHRCAALAVSVQGALATAQAAVVALCAGNAGQLSVLAPMARLVCADVFMTVAGEMVQLHGGIGFTFEHPAHLYLKRAKSTQLLFGSAGELRARVGRSAGI